MIIRFLVGWPHHRDGQPIEIQQFPGRLIDKFPGDLADLIRKYRLLIPPGRAGSPHGPYAPPGRWSFPSPLPGLRLSCSRALRNSFSVTPSPQRGELLKIFLARSAVFPRAYRGLNFQQPSSLIRKCRWKRNKRGPALPGFSGKGGSFP